jgi:hypothetical protein
MKTLLTAACVSMCALSAAAGTTDSGTWSLLPALWSKPDAINFSRIDPESVPGGVGLFVPAQTAFTIGLVFDIPAVPDPMAAWRIDGVVSTSSLNSFAFDLGDMQVRSCVDLTCATSFAVAGASFSQSLGAELSEYRFDAGLSQPGRYQWVFAVDNLQITSFSVTPQVDAVAAVPEPSSVVLMLAGLGVLGACRSRAKRARDQPTA